MSGTYSKLLGMKPVERSTVEAAPSSPSKKNVTAVEPSENQSATPDEVDAQNVEQKTAQTSKHNSAQENEHQAFDLPSSDDVETLSFRTRKDSKVKVNTEIPDVWKTEIDEIAHRLKVGKYELLAYVIGQFLNKV